jgi:undecaprenyl-diphosphatase
MTLIEAFILGIIQGITEFLPVSSSGHLVLFQSLLGLQNLEHYIFFDLVVHLGTLLAIFYVFWKNILDILRNDRFVIVQLFIAILPLFPLLLLIKPIKGIFDAPEYLGYFFLVTAYLLWAGIHYGWERDPAKLTKSRWSDPLLIGIFQAFAILPGVSRSGSTVSGARIMGWNYQKALTFSFLLAIPTILGGSVVELISAWSEKSQPIANVSFTSYFVGFISAFGIGVAALRFLLKLGKSEKWMIFVWYCLMLGIFTLIYFNYIHGAQTT